MKLLIAAATNASTNTVCSCSIKCKLRNIKKAIIIMDVVLGWKFAVKKEKALVKSVGILFPSKIRGGVGCLYGYAYYGKDT